MLFHFKRIELEKKLHTIISTMPRPRVVPFNYDSPFAAEQFLRTQGEMKYINDELKRREDKIEATKIQICALPSVRL